MSENFLEDMVKLTNAGERMVAGNSWGYWAHLSLYKFATPFIGHGRVLDAGSGSGYGAAYLSKHAAEVVAIDAGVYAIEHSRQRYAADGLTFSVADLNMPLPYADGEFDLVFSSNVFEHVALVDRLAAECARVVRPDGTVIIAVPPIVSAEMMTADMRNRFHLHHIPPTAWEAKFKRFFEQVECHGHIHAGAFNGWDSFHEQVALPEDQVRIRETDFAFPAISAADMMKMDFNITAIFVCRKRRVVAQPETIAERTPAEWREGEAAAALLSEAIHAKEAAQALLAESVRTAEQCSASEAAARAQMAGAAEALARAEAAVSSLSTQLQQANAETQQARETLAALEASEALRDARATRGPVRRLLASLFPRPSGK